MELSQSWKKSKLSEKLTTISSAWCALKSLQTHSAARTARAFSATIAWSHGSKWMQSAHAPTVRNLSGTWPCQTSCKEHSIRLTLNAMWPTATRSSLINNNMNTYWNIMLQNNIDARNKAVMTKKRCIQVLMNLFDVIGELVARVSYSIAQNVVVFSNLIITVSIIYWLKNSNKLRKSLLSNKKFKICVDKVISLDQIRIW